MAAHKFLKIASGVVGEEAAIVTSAGAGDDGKIPALDGTGKLDTSMMPVGIVSETDSIATSESLAAGDFVNIFASAGTKVRKADATVAGKHANGFVLAVAIHPTTATVYRISQNNTQLTGMTPGAEQFLSTSAGLRTETAPSGSGNVVQSLGVAKSATELIFQPSHPITLV